MYLKVLAGILYSKKSRISLLCLGWSSSLDLFSTLGNNALQRCKGRLGQIQPWVYISVPRAVKSSQIHFKSSNWLALTLLGQNVFFGVRSRECKDPGVEASPKYPNMFWTYVAPVLLSLLTHLLIFIACIHECMSSLPHTLIHAHAFMPWSHQSDACR